MLNINYRFLINVVNYNTNEYKTIIIRHSTNINLKDKKVYNQEE
jgi:hypothetical protein